MILCTWPPSAAQGDRYELQGPHSTPKQLQALYGLPVRSVLNSWGENVQKRRIRVFSPGFSGRLLDSFLPMTFGIALLFSLKFR